jgi:hypothetical protein
MFQTLNDWNDTLRDLGLSQSSNYPTIVHQYQMIDTIIDQNKTSKRVAPNKAERRRHAIYAWILRTWVVRMKRCSKMSTVGTMQPSIRLLNLSRFVS